MYNLTSRSSTPPSRLPYQAAGRRGLGGASRVVFPHTTPDGRLVNLYGRAVGTTEEVPKAKRHDHLLGTKGYFNATALQAVAAYSQNTQAALCA